jgi:hypothetical protein
LARVDFSRFDDSIVLHFEVKGSQINAYTLASALVAIADAAKNANYSINNGVEIEVVVETLSSGSFRAILRAIFSSAKKNLFSTTAAYNLILGVIGAYIYEHTLQEDTAPIIQINSEEVLIRSGEREILVPRKMYDAKVKAAKNPQFVNAVNRAILAISLDEKIDGIAITKSLDVPFQDLLIQRSALLRVTSEPEALPDTRQVRETIEVQILKAILEPSKRKWEFIWRGIKISAPINDNDFFVNFTNHDISIAPGDVLSVTIIIHQKRDVSTGIYTNNGYEIEEVHRHIPRIRQFSMPE